jgi:hypothetical protein
MAYLLTRRKKGGCFATANVGNLYVTCWYEKADMLALREAHDDMDEFRRTLDGKIAYVSIINQAAVQRPSAEMRTLLAKLSNEQTTWSNASLMVLLTNSLSGTIMRSLISSLLLLRKQQIPTKVVGSLEEGTPWIAPFAELHGTRLDPSLLAETLGALANARLAVA